MPMFQDMNKEVYWMFFHDKTVFFNMALDEVYLLSIFDVSSFFMTDLSISKLIVVLLTLGKPKLMLRVHFINFGQTTGTLLSLGKTLGCKKII